MGGHIEKNEMGGACSTYGENRGVYMVLVGKPEGKRPLGRPGRGWEDSIKMDLQEVGCGGMDWMWLRMGQVAGTRECGNEPSDSIKCGEPDNRLASQEGVSNESLNGH